jgi:hypothetical protein
MRYSFLILLHHRISFAADGWDICIALLADALLGTIQGYMAMGLREWRTFSRLRDGTWPATYTNCNYSYRSKTSQNKRKLAEKYSGRTSM